MKEIKQSLKTLIIESLMLEEIAPGDIGDDDLLFGGELGLDSVDALEIAMEVERVFKVSIPENNESRSIFKSVSTLAAHIQSHQPS